MADFALLEDLLQEPDQAGAYYFTGHTQAIVCTEYSMLPQALAAIETAQQAGHYIVGYVAYDSIYGLNDTILSSPPKPRHPLINCRVYRDYQWVTTGDVDDLLTQLNPPQPYPPLIHDLSLAIDLDTYQQKIAQLKQHLHDGDTYQVNFTSEYHYQLQGSPLQLYQALRHQQRVAYAALLQFDDLHIVSLSPELFFKKSGTDITCKPMKGTMPRAKDPYADQSLKKSLAQDPKNRAENVIIVDLIRNDLSQLAQPGSVNVPKLFTVETYQTLYQMTSEVCATIDKQVPLNQIINALFPCGSITGAPKKRTMQIIYELEQRDRSVYTGAIGMITPDNDMCFNVSIRTLVLQNQQGFLGVGGGIVYDSESESEYEEMCLKARFVTQLPVAFQLVETLYHNSKLGFPYLTDHLRRLSQSAQSLGFGYDAQAIVCQLKQHKTTLAPGQDYKVRLLLHKNGHVEIQSQLITLPHEPISIGLHCEPVINSNNVLHRYKTTDESVRGIYQHYFKTLAQPKDWFDVLLCNQHGYVAEGTRTNVFIQHDGIIKTPPLSAGVLAGIMRQRFIQQHPDTIECEITPAMVKKAERIWVTNAVIGIKEAVLRD